MAQSNQIIERLQETANQDLNSEEASDRNYDHGGSHGIAKKLSRNSQTQVDDALNKLIDRSIALLGGS